VKLSADEWCCVFVQSLSENNTKLEDDYHVLMSNLQVAMSQNHELLTQLLSVKDQRTEEQKLYV